MLGGIQINNHWKLSAFLIIFLSLALCLYGTSYGFAQIDQTSSKLQAANTAVNQAFDAVLAAEKAGANVTGLLAQLNDAAGILAQAENSYRTGDNNAALAQADSVLPIAQEVSVAAQEAKQTASVTNQNAIWSTVGFTVIGAFVFASVLFLVWRWFKKRYINTLIQTKPEVSN